MLHEDDVIDDQAPEMDETQNGTTITFVKEAAFMAPPDFTPLLPMSLPDDSDIEYDAAPSRRASPVPNSNDQNIYGVAVQSGTERELLQTALSDLCSTETLSLPSDALMSAPQG